MFSVIAALMAILGGGTMPEALAATVPTASVTATSTAVQAVKTTTHVIF